MIRLYIRGKTLIFSLGPAFLNTIQYFEIYILCMINLYFFIDGRQSRPNYNWTRTSTTRTVAYRETYAQATTTIHRNKQQGTSALNPAEETIPVVHDLPTRDRNGAPINVGDSVVFLTRGAYPSRGGQVIHVDQQWVVSRDNNEREIRRSPNNVQVVPAQVLEHINDFHDGHWGHD